MQWSRSSAIFSDGFGLVAHDFEAAGFGPAEHVAQVVCLAFDDHGTMTAALRERILVGTGMGSHVSPLLNFFGWFAPRDFIGNQLILLWQYHWEMGLARREPLRARLLPPARGLLGPTSGRWC